MGNATSHKPPDPYQFYWAGKRKLYPDWEAVKRIDEIVSQTPAHLRGKPSKLVPFLVSECHTQAEQFRAIFRWVTDNIRYDVNALNQGLARRYSVNRTLSPNSVEKVLSTGVAVCAGYANLMVELCEKAGIEVLYIGGMAKNDAYTPGDLIDLDLDQGHAWIAVKLGDQFYLCDPTWAAGSTDGTEGVKRFVHRFDETWFITEPRQFLETHWPRGEGNVGTREDALPEKQYLEKPMTDFNAWCRLPIRRGSTGRYPMLVAPLSHKDGIVETKNNMAAISFQYDSKCPLCVLATLTSLDNKRDLEGFTKVEHHENTYRVLVRLPVTTSTGYLLNIAAKPFYTAMEEVLTHVLCYKLETSGEVLHRPFPGDVSLPFLGPSKNFYDCGLQTKSPNEIRSKDGSARVIYTMQKDLKKRRNIMGKLVYGNETTNLKGEFCLGSVDRQLHAELRLKREGEYLFSILVQSVEKNDTYYYICSHIVVCDKASTELDSFPGRERPYGTTTYFRSHSYKLHSKSYLFTTTNGRCSVVMTIPKGRSVAFCLQKNGRKYDASDESIYAEWTNGKVRFNLQIPESGYFTFAMNELDGDKAGEWLACFLVHCPSAYGGNPYPKLSTIWGPSRDFDSSGCRLLRQRTSTIRTKNGCARLTIKNMYQLSQLSFKLTNIQNQDCSRSLLAESKGEVIIFYFRFKENGNYRFSLHLLTERGTWKSCLLNILVVAENQWIGEMFTQKPRLIGEHPKVRDLSLTIATPKNALTQTTTGRCQVVLTGKLPVQLFHILMCGEEEMNDRVYCETDGHQSRPELKYHFELPKVGMYNFLIHTDAQKGREVYSAEIECTNVGVVLPFFTAKPVPHYQLGLVHGNRADIELSLARSSTLRLVNGIAKLVLKIGNPNVEKLMAWYHCTKNDERRLLGHHVMVERSGPRVEVTVAPPEPKRYLLVLGAKMKDSENLVKVGTFLVEPGNKLPKYNGFPVRYQTFYTTEGCRFVSPYRTTLERDRVYDVEIFIPGATRIVVGGTVLDSKTRSNYHRGQVKVKPADKTLMVSAVFKVKGKEDVVHYLKFDVANKTKEQFITASI